MKKLRPILFAISFFTIIPLKNIRYSEEDIKNSIKFFPLAGLFIGIILYVVSIFNLDIEIKSLFILFIWEFLSGFFHLDGVADTSDAIFSSVNDRDKLFKIMNDSNIGTMGAVIIFFLLFGKYILLKSILIYKSKAIIIIPVIGRYAVNFLSWKMNYAKKEGLGKFICENNTNNQFFISTILTVLLIFLFYVKIIFSFVLCLFLLFLYSLYFHKKFKGATGDIFGFSVETTELFFLFLLTTF